MAPCYLKVTGSDREDGCMILRMIAYYRGKRAFNKWGTLNQSLNPYTPSINRVDDRWTNWYEGHRDAYYKTLRVNRDDHLDPFYLWG